LLLGLSKSSTMIMFGCFFRQLLMRIEACESFNLNRYKHLNNIHRLIHPSKLIPHVLSIYHWNMFRT
jgi:hypothetical protein